MLWCDNNLSLYLLSMLACNLLFSYLQAKSPRMSTVSVIPTPSLLIFTHVVSKSFKQYYMLNFEHVDILLKHNFNGIYILNVINVEMGGGSS